MLPAYSRSFWNCVIPLFVGLDPRFADHLAAFACFLRQPFEAYAIPVQRQNESSRRQTPGRLRPHRIRLRPWSECPPFTGHQRLHFAVNDFHEDRAIEVSACEFLFAHNRKGQWQHCEGEDPHRNDHFSDQCAAPEPRRVAFDWTNHHKTPASMMAIKIWNTATARVPTSRPFRRTSAVVINWATACSS